MQSGTGLGVFNHVVKVLSTKVNVYRKEVRSSLKCLAPREHCGTQNVLKTHL